MKRRRLERELQQAEEEQRLEDWLGITSAKVHVPHIAVDLEKIYERRYGTIYNAKDFRYCDGLGWVRR
ncbi:MAG: hypothetical protein KKB31_05920 [Nanoarchaeota archaeon]|nr:hypothetical protein [Nanoarchaeota archaeon]